MNTRMLLLLGIISVLLMGCMTGSIEMGDPQWDPPVISKEGCPNLDGKYRDHRGSLNRGLTQNDGLFNEQQLRATKISYRKIPVIPHDKAYFERLGVIGENAVRSARARDEAAQEQAFYDHAVTSIRQQGRSLEVTLMDGAGVEYSKTTVNLDHPQVGCHNGALVIRELSRHFGAELSKGWASAGENEYRKLNGGVLQVIVRSRDWVSSMTNEPRRSEATLLFPSVP